MPRVSVLFFDQLQIGNYFSSIPQYHDFGCEASILEILSLECGSMCDACIIRRGTFITTFITWGKYFGAHK